MARKEITEREVKNLAVGAHITDTLIKGFLARRLPSGVISLRNVKNAICSAGFLRYMGLLHIRLCCTILLVDCNTSAT